MPQEWILGIALFVIGLPWANNHGFFGYVGLTLFALGSVAFYQTIYHSDWLKRWRRERAVGRRLCSLRRESQWRGGHA